MYCESCTKLKAEVRVFFANSESFLVCWDCAIILQPHTVKLVESLKGISDFGFTTEINKV